MTDKQLKVKHIKQFYEEYNPEFKSAKSSAKILAAVRREWIYFTLALIFGFVLNLSSTCLSDFIKALTSNELSSLSSGYITYTGIVFGITTAILAYMIAKLRDFSEYIRFFEDKKR